MKSYGPLNNYIEMHRQRVGLSQADLACLISVENGSSISRYEQGLRFPNLESLLALEIVLGQPIQEIYAGIADRVRENVKDEAERLLLDLDDTPSKELALKLEVLSRLVHPDESTIVPIWEE